MQHETFRLRNYLKASQATKYETWEVNLFVIDVEN